MVAFLRNLLPRVLRLFGQRLVARRDSGELEFYYRRISAVKQCKPLRSSHKKIEFFFKFSRVSPGDPPLTKSLRTLGTRLIFTTIDQWSAVVATWEMHSVCLQPSMCSIARSLIRCLSRFQAHDDWFHWVLVLAVVSNHYPHNLILRRSRSLAATLHPKGRGWEWPRGNWTVWESGWAIFE